MRGWILGVSLAVVGACGGSSEPAATEPVAAPAVEAAPAAEAAPAPATAAGRVWFVEPQDGATVKAPVKVVFGVEGMGVHPAGELVAGTGHHHLIIDGAGVQAGSVVPKDEKHMHFGQGQTETTVELAPGEHTLTLQFADGSHTSFGEPMSTTIKVKVE
jgi:hypothetical protein